MFAHSLNKVSNFYVSSHVFDVISSCIHLPIINEMKYACLCKKK